MIRLPDPQFDFHVTVNKCLEGIAGNNILVDKLDAARTDLIVLWQDYGIRSGNGRLFEITPTIGVDFPETVIVNPLNKRDLIKLYEQYFVPKSKPARAIYNSLINSSLEQCPFCGGIGNPTNLDHFLPKTKFPQFSILPLNLVPSCRDCNTGSKSTHFASKAEEQIIQPYKDDSKFFDEQWIFADYQSLNGGLFKYYVKTPEPWKESESKKAHNHFDTFNLGHRYSIQAAENLECVLRQIRELERYGLDRGDIDQTVLQPQINSVKFKNHWKVGMAQALIKDRPVKAKIKLKKGKTGVPPI